MRSILLGACLVCVIAGSAHADVIYSFNVAPVGSNFEAVSFSFTVATFVTAGKTPAFTPFAVTDGTHSWLMSEDRVGHFGSQQCYSFGTATNSVLLDSCGFLPFPPGGAGFTLLAASSPSSPGTYALLGIFGGSSGPSQSFIGSSTSILSGSLTIREVTTTTVPEPSSLTLLGGAMMFATAWKLRRSRPLKE